MNARHTIAPVCGGCGSANLLMTQDTDCSYAVCQNCLRLQEAETRADPCTHMCDNCAFRPNSPERADPYRWWQIEEAAIEGGQPFYCHKGMNAHLQGGTMTYLPGDLVETMQPCAGWLANRLAYLARQVTL